MDLSEKIQNLKNQIDEDIARGSDLDELYLKYFSKKSRACSKILHITPCPLPSTIKNLISPFF